MSAFIKSIEEAQERTRKRLEEQAKLSAILPQEIKSVMTAIPNLKKVVVRGYTPGFNDGDPCYHSQCEPLFFMKDSSNQEEDDDEDLEECEWYSLKKKLKGNKEEYDSVESLNKLLNSAEGLFQEMFGTDWEVEFTLSPEGEVLLTQNGYYCGY